MHRSKQIVIASILTALYASVTIIRVSIALATQNQDAQDFGNGFLVIQHGPINQVIDHIGGIEAV